LIYLLALSAKEIGIMIAYLILSLSILVVLHEFGHFITARWFKCRVEKFYLFFDPWFSVVKKKIGDTEYGIGWLPLGGYVKISGMIDESMDKEQLKKPAESWEFRSKPAWQRLIIMLGGVTVNILLAFLIYAMVLFTWGEKKVLNGSLKYGMAVTDSLMLNFGFKDGDIITSVNGNEVKYYDDLLKQLILGNKATVLRNGVTSEIVLPENLIGQLVDRNKSKKPIFAINMPVVIDSVPPKSYADSIGLAKGDRFVSINGNPTMMYADYNRYVSSHTGTSVLMRVLRNIKDTLTIAGKIDQDGRIGFIRESEEYDSLAKKGLCELYTKKYGFFESFPAGVRMSWDRLSFYVAQFGKILSPKTGAYKGVGGFASMASIMPTQWGEWRTFWNITAFLSIILAFMNLLPIPALDGGHALFTIIEMITGKRPSEKFLEYAQMVGMVLLLGLMLYANGNDIYRWLFKK
jgi:regulator of sigma E protease